MLFNISKRELSSSFSFETIMVRPVEVSMSYLQISTEKVTDGITRILD
jgi:hypothetical protein